MRSKSIEVGGLVPGAETLLARAEKFRTTTLESGAFAWEFIERGPNVAALREAARLGMTGIEVDRDLGGLGFGFREKVRVAEILSRSSIGFAFSLLNTQNVAARLAIRGADRHRDEFLSDLLAGRRFGATALTEPGAGSDFAAITTRADRTDGGWVLNGQKAWISNAAIADVFLCYAQTDPDRGRDGIACFVVDGRREGCETTDGYQLVSGSTVGVGGFSLDGYRAAEDDMITEPGAGFRQALVGVNGARISVAAMACAAVRAALGQAIDHGLMREAFGRPILEHQGLAWKLASVANRLEAAEALTARAVDCHDESQAAGVDVEAGRVSALAAAHAKKFATEMVEPALETCMQAMGAEGLRPEYATGRLLSESRILSYVDGTTEMQTERIARSLARFYGPESAAASVVTAATSAPTSSEPSSVIDLSESGSESDERIAEYAVDASDGVDPSDDVLPATTDEVEESTEQVPAARWSNDPFSHSRQAGGLFAEPEADMSSRDLFDRGPIADDAESDTATTLSDATRTTEFEPTGDVDVDGGVFVDPPPSSSDVPEAAAPPPPPEPPMPIEPSPVPVEPDGAELPSVPPMPPPHMGDPTGLGSPPPPPPPPAPPLSTDQPGVLPPVPPPEFLRAADPEAAPPLPGDEHRLDAEVTEPPSTPPLPPDSMRQHD